jgi:hypothetical protein
MGMAGLIVKYDTSGNVLWKKINNTLFTSVAIGDNSIIAVGAALGSTSYEAGIVKYDTSGNQIWTKILGGNGEWMFYYGITVLNDEYYATGFTDSTNIPDLTISGSTDAVIIKYDTNGNIIWKDAYGSSYTGGSSPPYDDCFYSATSDGNYIIASGSIHTTVTTGKADFAVVKYDTDGSIVWDQTYGGSGNDAIWGGVIKDTNKYVFIGVSYSTTGIFNGINHGLEDGAIFELNE